MPEAEPLLRVEGLSKSYYGLRAVTDLSFAVEGGSITGLIGPNGSGKSTTIDCISGFQRADAGRWFLAGHDLTGLPPHRNARAGLTRTFQAVRAYEELSLVDNLCLAAQSHDGVGWWSALRGSAQQRMAEARARQRAQELLALFGIERYAEAPAGILSYGQRKLLAIAASVMSRPRIVLLDEPVAGVTPKMIRRIEELIRNLNREGVTFVIVEHNVDFILNLCQRVIVMESGRKLAEGAPAMIRNDPKVLAAYMGVADTATGAVHG